MSYASRERIGYLPTSQKSTAVGVTDSDSVCSVSTHKENITGGFGSLLNEYVFINMMLALTYAKI